MRLLWRLLGIRKRCPKCRIEMERDVVDVLNIEKKYLTLKGPVPLSPMPNEPTLKIAVLPMERWVRRKSLETALKHHKITSRDKRLVSMF